MPGEQAASAEAAAVIDALQNGTFETIYGEIGFDAKGDVTGYDPFTWYVWENGEIVPARLAD